MSNILVTAIGSFAADVVITNLNKTGHRIVGCDIYEKDLVANSLIVDKFYQSPYASDVSSYVQFVKEICVNEAIDFIIPLTDVEIDVLNVNRNDLKDAVLCISPKETIEICRDKYKLYQFLKSKGIDSLIPTERLAHKDVSELTFPCVIKPYDGRSSQGLNFIANQKEFDYFFENNQIDNYIIQPIIAGKIVTVDILRKKNEFVATARIELLRTINGAGTSVKVFKNEKLLKICEEISERLNIFGCVNFEFIQLNENEYRFLECNPRFSGGVAFSCLSGYDYVNNHLRCFTDEVLDGFSQKNMTIARKYNEFITNVE